MYYGFYDDVGGQAAGIAFWKWHSYLREREQLTVDCRGVGYKHGVRKFKIFERGFMTAVL
jgi:hypothetical protein